MRDWLFRRARDRPLVSAHGWRIALTLWRAQAALSWVIHVITPKRWWARSTYPGLLLVMTCHESGARAVELAIRRSSRRSLRSIHQLIALHEPVDHETSRRDLDQGHPESAGFAAWQLRVARGRERAVLEELEYRIANALAHEAGYELLGRRAKLELARRIVFNNQVRQVRLASGTQGRPSAPVNFVENKHATNRARMLGVEPTEPVEVAILDTAVDFDHLPPDVRARTHWGEVRDDVKAFTPDAHGAVTASIVGDLAPTATLHIFPIAAPGDVGGDLVVGESLVLTSLMWTQAHVVVMCFDLPPRSAIAKQSEKEPIRQAIDKIATRPVVVVAAGNARNPANLDLHFPATLPNVVAVGAVNEAGKRSMFSSYRFAPDDEPGLLVVAPGGDLDGSTYTDVAVTSGDVGFAGTSVAAAYAAGVVARWLATMQHKGAVDSAERFRTLAAATDTTVEPLIECGAGLIKQP